MTCNRTYNISLVNIVPEHIQWLGVMIWWVWWTMLWCTTNCCPGLLRSCPLFLWVAARSHCLALVGKWCWQLWLISLWWCAWLTNEETCAARLVEYWWNHLTGEEMAIVDGMVAPDDDSQGGMSQLQKLLFLLFLVEAGAVYWCRMQLDEIWVIRPPDLAVMNW